MYRITQLVVIAFTVPWFMVMPAKAQDVVQAGKKGEVQFSHDTRIGSTLLTPNHYQFQHRWIGGQHVLVIREQVPLPVGQGTHRVSGAGREVARVKCTALASDTKVKATTLYRVTDPDGVMRIVRIDIAGEKQGHMISLEPASDDASR